MNQNIVDIKSLLKSKGVGGLALLDYSHSKGLYDVKTTLKELSFNGHIFLPLHVKENIWSKSEDKGWGNGYVDIPMGHPLFGKSVKYIKEHSNYGLVLPIVSYCDISETGWWRVGFDSINRKNLKKENILDITLTLLIELYTYKVSDIEK